MLQPCHFAFKAYLSVKEANAGTLVTRATVTFSISSFFFALCAQVHDYYQLSNEAITLWFGPGPLYAVLLFGWSSFFTLECCTRATFDALFCCTSRLVPTSGFWGTGVSEKKGTGRNVKPLFGALILFIDKSLSCDKNQVFFGCYGANCQYKVWSVPNLARACFSLCFRYDSMLPQERSIVPQLRTCSVAQNYSSKRQILYLANEHLCVTTARQTSVSIAIARLGAGLPVLFLPASKAVPFCTDLAIKQSSIDTHHMLLYNQVITYVWSVSVLSK